jgi:hypothetical protein
MSFDPSLTEQQLSESIGAMVLLHASNQALIEVSITPSPSLWYPILNQELGAIENLVVDWRERGFLYFQQQILQQVVTCGQAFLDARAGMDQQFDQLVANFNPALQQQIANELNQLQAPVKAMQTSLAAYLAQLQQFQTALVAPHHNMVVTVARIQAQAAQIQAQITAINQEIANLQQQLVTDRQAIAKAKAAEHRGIVETIFGVLLAPVTGGLSLILAGIGVASIADAEEKVSQLQSQITSSHAQIVSDQGQLSDDDKQISTLKGLTLCVDMALTDIDNIVNALGSLRTGWSVLAGEIQSEAQNVAQSDNAQSAVMSQVWFDAACNGWQNIIQFAQDYANRNAPVAQYVQIG